MPVLTLVSRDAAHYQQIISAYQLPELSVRVFDNGAPFAPVLSDVQLVLGEPDRIAPHLQSMPAVQWVQSTWAGVTPLINHPRRDYRLTGVKGVFGQQMREYVFAYLLHYSRAVEHFQALKTRQSWQPVAPGTLAGKSLGILGVGSIGQAVAKTAKAFDMRVLGMSNRSRDCAHVDVYFDSSQCCDMASQCDYLVCLLPHTPDTERLVDASVLASLPNHAVLMNAGRGQVIDEDALIAALNGGTLRAAVLDVFNTEPLPAEHPFWRLENLQITQHTAALSNPEEIAALFKRNYLAFMAGESLSGEVDFNQGY